MTTFTEGDLQVEFRNIEDARKFDDVITDEKLSHCMKSVDFIVELPNQYLFIEFKDPQHPESSGKQQQQFIREFQNRSLNEDLKYKYRDSFLYEWASGRADKPVYYLVLIALDSIAAPDLNANLDDLKRKLPLQVPKSKSWTRPIVAGCGVFNLGSWNQRFPDYPVTRLSAGGQP